MRTQSLPQCTLEQYETEAAGRHLVHGALAFWAKRAPDAVAVVNATRGTSLDWATFEHQTSALAARLLQLGLGRGDFLAASLPLATEHLLLEYACFKIGVIHAPLDLRMSPAEVLRALGMLGARAFAFLGATAAADFSELGRAVKRHCPYVEHLLQLAPAADVIEGALSLPALIAESPRALREVGTALAERMATVGEHDGAQVIFTTGSTGSPKPALLSHRSITAQNLALATGLGFAPGTRMLVNLPPSHVGAQAETLMTTLFAGGTAIVLEVFDPLRSLQAIEAHRVNLVGQIPAMFAMEWRLPEYATTDLSSLELAVYGGQQVGVPFLDALARMAPRIATGLGLTEASGFCTYTAPGASAAELADSIGRAQPIYPMTIRRPMLEDGRAGDELPAGDVGHVCFCGPQTFLGYVGDPEATRRTISSDGFLYTGDMGWADERGLHFSGRSKWVIKSAGYQVFPGDVEAALASCDDRIAACGVVGVDHQVRGEGIVAFVEAKPGAEIDPDELKRRARALATYLRPLHVVALPPGALPLNRVVKTDYVRLAEMAAAEVAGLRSRRRWDR